MSDLDDRILHAHLEEQKELWVELCVRFMDDECSRGNHDRQPDEFEGETVWSCSWCGLPV